MENRGRERRKEREHSRENGGEEREKNRGNEIKRSKKGLYSRLKNNKKLAEEWTVNLQKWKITVAI